MNENNETMTTSEEQIVLEDGSEEVAIPVANYKTLTQGISYDSDVRDSSRYLQIGYHANNDSLLSISFTTPNKMKNALIRSADLELNQIYALCAETGSRIDLYQVPAANTDNVDFSSMQPVDTVYLTDTDNHTYHFDITDVVKQSCGTSCHLVVKVDSSQVCHTVCNCSDDCCCNCQCACTASNAIFINIASVKLTCAGEPIEDGVYQMMNQANLRHLTAGQNWVKPGDIVTQRYGKTTDPVTLLGQLWRIRCLPNGYYAINSIMNPHMGLSAQMIDSVHRVVVRDIGDCTADVPSEAQWMIIPCDGNWILYNVAVGKVISTTCCNCDDDVPLNMVSYSDECCVECAHWRVWNNNYPPTETVLHNDLIGWVRDTSVRVALPVGATTQFHAACYAESCNCCSGWRSSNSTVASVDSTGKVTALSAGNTTISVTMGGNYVECPVTVVEGDIAIIKYSDHAQKNGTIQLQAVTVAGNETITWTSEDEEKATVDSNGLVTVKMVGAFDITASATGKTSQTVTLYGMIPDGVYMIKNEENGKCVAIKEDELVKNTTVSAKASASVAEQKWHILYKADGKYIIRSYANSKMVFGYNDEYPNNTYVFSYVMTAALNSPQHNWTITQIDGAYVLKNCSTNKVLTISDSNAYTADFASGNNKQHWLLNPTNAPEEIVLYDETNSKYLVRDTVLTKDENNVTTTTMLDRSTVYLEPNVVHQYRAIRRAAEVMSQAFTWTPDDTNAVTVYGNGCVQTCEELAEGAKSTSVMIKATGSDLTYELIVGVRIPVRSVELQCCMTMVAGHKVFIAPTITPSNATYSKLTWLCNCSNTKADIVKESVEKTLDTGEVIIQFKDALYAYSEGTYRVVARVLDYDGTVHEAEMTVNVKAREDVRIEKDGDFFKVVFVDKESDDYARVWKSVECDLSQRENPYNIPLADVTINSEDYEYLTPAEKRYIYNRDRKYSAKQLGFLYLLDPLGVIYYVKNGFKNFERNESNWDKRFNNYLFFKDSIYNEVYGKAPDCYTLDEFGNQGPITGSLEDRCNYYSDAELILGTHNTKEDVYELFDWLYSLTTTVLKFTCPQWGFIFDLIDVGKDAATILFYEKGLISCQDAVSDIALSNYVQQAVYDPSEHLEKLSTIKGIFDIVTNAYDALSIKASYIEEIQDVATCYRFDQHPKYHVILKTNDDITMEELVTYCR